ncbi:MAG: radical SAM protein [Bacteroidales bacterium]|nr:radical SAM protein [Bacteroidales bacterium]
MNDGITLNGEVKETADYLYSNYYIVESEEEDKGLYQQCSDLVYPPAISNAYIVVTENCNFNCKYCFISDIVSANDKNKVMTKEVAKASVELLQRTFERQHHDYDKTITFYGGEPLLNFEVIEYFMQEVDRMKASTYWPGDVKFAIITNGSLLTKEHIDFLRENNIALSISYDVDKQSHSNRSSRSGQDTFDDVRKNIQMCIDEQMPYSLSITISENTIRNREAVLNEIASLQPLTIAFNMLIPNKHLAPSSTYYEDATDFMIECFKQLRTNGLYEDRMMRKVQAFIDNKMYLYDCCASGGNQFAIAPDGSIGICHGYLNNRKYFSANVMDKDFDFRNSPDFAYWEKRSPLFMPECQECECIGICGGGCPYAADYLHGSIYALDDRFCIHAKKVLEWLIIDLYEQTKMA